MSNESSSRHEGELSARLFRPSATLQGTDVATLPFVNNIRETLSKEAGLVALSLRGSHVLGYDGPRDEKYEKSDLDIGLLYNSSAEGFNHEGLLASEEKRTLHFEPLEKQLGIFISFLGRDVGPILRARHLPQNQSYFIEVAAMLCEWLVYDYHAAAETPHGEDPKIRELCVHMARLMDDAGPSLGKELKKQIVKKLGWWEMRREDKMQHRLSSESKPFNYLMTVAQRRRMWEKHVNDIFSTA